MAERGRGSVQDHFDLGESFYHGIGVEADRHKALHWYLKAANRDHLNAQHMAGVCYDEGTDYEQALFWFRKASDRGYLDSQTCLAMAMFDGNGCEKDPVNALALCMPNGNWVQNSCTARSARKTRCEHLRTTANPQIKDFATLSSASVPVS